jgi:hypothetical protein
MGVVILSICITAKLAQLLLGALIGRVTDAWRR